MPTTGLTFMSTHWRTTQRDDPRFHPPMDLDESIVTPDELPRPLVEWEPLGAEYGPTADDSSIRIPAMVFRM